MKATEVSILLDLQLLLFFHFLLQIILTFLVAHQLPYISIFLLNPLNLLLLLCFLLPQLPNSIRKITQQNPLILGGLTINPRIIAAIPGLLHSNCTAN